MNFHGYSHTDFSGFLVWFKNLKYSLENSDLTKQKQELTSGLEFKYFPTQDGKHLIIIYSTVLHNTDESTILRIEPRIEVFISRLTAHWTEVSIECVGEELHEIYQTIICRIEEKWKQFIYPNDSRISFEVKDSKLKLMNWINNCLLAQQRYLSLNAPDLGGPGNMYIVKIYKSLNQIKTFFQMNKIESVPFLTVIDATFHDDKETEVIQMDIDFPKVLTDWVTSFVLQAYKNFPSLCEKNISDSVEQKTNVEIENRTDNNTSTDSSFPELNKSTKKKKNYDIEPRVPKFLKVKSRWQRIWKIIKPHWNYDKEFTKNFNWYNDRYKNDSVCIDTFRDIIRAGEAGLLDDKKKNE